ncbi:hypothetical protein Tco_0110679 [Tanacetum coccineum]
MKPHESTSEFAGKLSSIQAKFKSLGGTLKDKVLVRKLLNSVPKKFLPIVASIEQYQEIDTMQFEEAVGRITTFEERLKSQDEPESNYQNKLLLASSNNQGGGRGHGRNFTKNKNSYGKGTSRGSIDKSKLRRYECGFTADDHVEMNPEDIQAAKTLVLMANDYLPDTKNSMTAQKEAKAAKGLSFLVDHVDLAMVESKLRVEEFSATNVTERQIHVEDSADTSNGGIKMVLAFDLDEPPALEDDSSAKMA